MLNSLPFSLKADFANVGGGSSGPLLGIMADEHIVMGVALTPGWDVVSAFYLATAFTSPVAFEGIMLVSQGALVARARLYDPTAGAAVAGSTLAGTSSLSDVRQVTGDLSAAMPAGRIYQVQFECTGGALPADFGTLRSAKLFKL